MTCEHTHIQTWRFKDTGESAQMWSCVACAEKFLPIRMAWAESQQRAEDMRDRAAKTAEVCDDVESAARFIRALPVDRLPAIPKG